MLDCSKDPATMIESSIPLQGDMEDNLHQGKMLQGDFHQEAEGRLCRKRHSRDIPEREA